MIQINFKPGSLRPAGKVAALALLLSACESGLESVNVDRTRLRDVDPIFQLNDVIASSAPPADELRCEGTTVQQFVRVSTGFFACANFNVAVLATMGHQWGGNYGRLLELNDVLGKTQDEAALQNLYNMARIMRAHATMKITDTYGDMPYTEAARALEGIVFPAYDDQEQVYTGAQGVLEELESASAALSASAPAPDDALYGGDLDKWRRFGNSLLLRAAMRLTKVAPGLAEQYASAAYQGGVMQSNADNALVRHNANYTSAIGGTGNGNEKGNAYLPETFVEYLRSMGDPRLEAIAVRWPESTGPASQTAETRVFGADEQIGMPMGYDQTTIAAVLPDYGLGTHYQFSRADPFRMYDLLAPGILVTYSQTQLLLAEAALRGWVPGDPATYYENAIRADMERISTDYNDTEIPASEIDAYVAAHPFDAANALEQINNEYWVASYMAPHESWSNFRRSGYPAIAPNPLRGDLSTEDFFRRLLYPEDELNLNPNYSNGTLPDMMDTRVWWDVDMAGQGGVGPNG
jgi:Starch-binding associating with outer membrane